MNDSRRHMAVGVTSLLLIGGVVSALGVPSDQDQVFTRSDDSVIEAARHKLAREQAAERIEATSIQLGLSLEADQKEDWFANEMYSLGIMQDSADPKAQAPSSAPAGGEDLAGQATNPVAPLIQLQLQNNSVFESNSGDGYSNAFVVQPVIPWKMGETAVLTRITLPLLVSTPDLGDPIGREYGNGDLVVLNAFTKTINQGTKWQAMVGPIASITVPTASSDFLGEGKYQVGPGYFYINTGTKGLQWGIFGYQQWSFASAGGDEDRPEVSRIYFQPILTKHFEGGYYIALGDFLWSVDFNDNDRWSIPFGIRFGHVTKFGDQPVNLFVEPWWDISGNNKGNEWGVKFNVTFLFPTSP